MADFISWKDADDNEHGITAEVAVQTLKTTNSAEVAKFPVEDGSLATDHVILNPPQVEFHFTVSQTPTSDEAGMSWVQETLDVRKSEFTPHGLLALTSAVGGAISAIAGLAGANTTKVWVREASSIKDYIATMHDKLIEVQSKAYLLKVTFGSGQGSDFVRVFEDYLIENIELTYDAGFSSGAGSFVVTASKFKKIKTARTGLPKPADLRLKLPSLSKGKKPTAESTGNSQADTQIRSFLSGGLGAIGGALGL